jgi:hypothetical protein
MSAVEESQFKKEILRASLLIMSYAQDDANCIGIIVAFGA